MKFNRFSPKQMKVFTWWMDDQYDAIIADGAIRSGKTSAMSISYVLWATKNYNGQSFAFCGKTIESLRRNVIFPLFGYLEGLCEIKERISQHYIEITMGGRTNRFYLFGGRDESSYMLIQGITLAGVLLDEVALMPRSFVEQAIARCSVAGSKFWFNCNPEHPQHWFYTEWIEQADKKRALRLKFTLDDNLSLDPQVRQRYESLYTGVFYDRYILGLWVVAEGLIYPEAAQGKYTVPDDPQRRYTQYYISIDYGTLNPCSMGLWGLSDGVWYRIKEYYHSGRDTRRQLTDEEYYDELVALADGLPIRSVIIDPSAASFIATIRKHGKYHVRPADNAVLDGIRNTAKAMQSGKVRICESCTNTIAEFAAYRWDEKSAEDKPIKENDHAMDDIRYFVNTVMDKSLGVINLGR